MEIESESGEEGLVTDDDEGSSDGGLQCDDMCEFVLR